MSDALATGSIAGLATAGVIIRPARLPEAIWAVAGAVALVAFGLISPRLALAGVAKGYDVYLFLVGMMLLAEVARREGLFDGLARLSTAFAKGFIYSAILILELRDFFRLWSIGLNRFLVQASCGGFGGFAWKGSTDLRRLGGQAAG